ncbi:hypothetical protein GH714_021120 [Hevea brasiliensis]|uniref:Retrovirus-related Pol polyprotein from transposon TNT 1-94-like beta-barrel domain-containing protein n=1 Tax=Hevea brasiliensis TaxID=3981 RepID=A0A6A6M2K5_HEVBR|nr:hypothetical protein GH714_021120 [Hevea brasiliensis]
MAVLSTDMDADAEAQVALLKKGIAEFYDESSGICGDHMHHGFYDPNVQVSGSLSDHRAAQIRMIEEALRFGGVPGDPKRWPKKVVDVGCGIGDSSRYLAKKFGAHCQGISLSPVQVLMANSPAATEGLADKSDFARSLKHKPKNFSFDELLVSLRIEDRHHLTQPQNQEIEFQAKANVVENFHKPKSKNFKKVPFKKNFNGNNNNKMKGIRTRSVRMGNGSEAQVLGEGQIKLEFSFGNFLVLDGVFHVPSIIKNLISASLLDQHGFKLVLGSNKVVISKHGNFIGKGYLVDGLYKLNVMSSSINAVSFTYVTNVECDTFWHDFVRFESNIVDPLTKGLARQQILQTSRGMGLKPIE